MNKPHSAPSTKATTKSPDSVCEVDSKRLLGRDGRIRIRHDGQIYELRETRFGKLILTKPGNAD